jgi:hypothetical protein
VSELALKSPASLMLLCHQLPLLLRFSINKEGSSSLFSLLDRGNPPAGKIRG